MSQIKKESFEKREILIGTKTPGYHHGKKPRYWWIETDCPVDCQGKGEGEPPPEGCQLLSLEREKITPMPGSKRVEEIRQAMAFQSECVPITPEYLEKARQSGSNNRRQKTNNRRR